LEINCPSTVGKPVGVVDKRAAKERATEFMGRGGKEDNIKVLLYPIVFKVYNIVNVTCILLILFYKYI